MYLNARDLMCFLEQLTLGVTDTPLTSQTLCTYFESPTNFSNWNGVRQVMFNARFMRYMELQKDTSFESTQHVNCKQSMFKPCELMLRILESEYATRLRLQFLL